MNKPVIGIVPALGPDPRDPTEREIYIVGKPYADRIVEAGGIPLIVPHNVDPADVFNMVDGWLVIGGHDIEPSHYGQQPHPKTETEPQSRFKLERALYESVPNDMPVLGICYGCQFINVVRGGDLIQHLPDTVGHGGHAGGTMQSYRVEPGSLAASALGDTEVEGRSYHHQAVANVGQGLKVTAWSEDGTVEAVEDANGRWLLAVQWHPERTPENPASVHLFRQFVDQAAKFKASKLTCGTW